MKRFLGIILCAAVFFGFNSRLFAAMKDYCQSPPFLVTPAQPNIMMTVDVSGSMSWSAYYATWTETNVAQSYNATQSYEGYFIPAKVYKTVSGVWTETADAEACSLTYNTSYYGWGGIYNYANWFDISGTCSGNKLNFALMARIDLVRWAMTGGNPATCTGNATFDKNQCDPELWQEPGNSGKVGSVCNDTIGGCILLANDGTQVKVPWVRVRDGLAFQFELLSLKPRLGAMFFSDSGIRSAGKVSVGDFTAANSTSATWPYINLITSMNSSAPGGGTPTGPAMWDTLNYFRQTAPQYGGLAVQSGIGDKWKNPMYICDAGSGANCKLVSCAQNYTLLMSDGSWNSPSCSISDGKSDPVQPAYQMHEGFTNVGSGIATDVSGVYAIGLFLGGTGEQSLKNVAMYGSFNKSGRLWPDSLTGYPQNTCYMNDCGDGKGSGCTPLPGSSTDWDVNVDNVPDTFYNASDAAGIKQTIMNAVTDMLKKASSGTAVSVLSSSDGSGANLMQSLFYPKRAFADGKEISWTSDLMNYWYYLDPYIAKSTIREDTVREGANEVPPYTLLNLKQDYKTSFKYDATQKKTIANRWEDTTGTGSPLTVKPSVDIEDSVPIWRAGFNLWWTDPTARNIYTSVDVLASNSPTPQTPPTLIPFKPPLVPLNLTNNDKLIAANLGQPSKHCSLLTSKSCSSNTDCTSLTEGTCLEDNSAANATINYVRGYDCVDGTGAAGECGTTYPNKIGRNRTVTAGVCSARKSPCNSSTDCPSGETCNSNPHVWKLGDIISSTPRIMGPGSLNNFNIAPPFGYNDQTYKDFIKSNDYQDRQLAFVGSNDGMLHAFKLGKLLQKWAGKNWYEAAKQEGATGIGGIGTESYAFIPKNVLPYLQYLHDVNYCHISMVDGPTTLTDVSINMPSTCNQTDYWNCPKLTTISSNAVDFTKTSWRTTLIGSAGIGGATCDAAAPDPDRISTPLSVGGTPVGWSSYFALDVTDQTAPKLLWEFSNADLGVTNVGSGVVKAGGSLKRCAISNDVCTADTDCANTAIKGNCVNTNGRWFTILASGSTGPISALEFKGTSDKTLKLFVLDLKTGALLRTIDTGITNAFAGSISSSALDLEKDRPGAIGNYQDDAVYIGYVKDTTSGGVLRLVINNDINPANWTVSKVIDNIGPVTTSVVNLLDRNNGKLWLYFAEGRYSYKTDDLTTQRKLYGIQEPCFDAARNSLLTYDPATHLESPCTSTLALTDMKDQTTLTKVCSSSGGVCSTTADCPNGQTCNTLPLTVAQKGWYIKMNAELAPMSAERVITNPTPDTQGAVYFVSVAPNADICAYGGKTYLWALDYKTGGAVTFVTQAKAYVQVSTGEVSETNVSDVDRKKELGDGIASKGDGVMVIKNPDPIKKFMHVQEQ